MTLDKVKKEDKCGKSSPAGFGKPVCLCTKPKKHEGNCMGVLPNGQALIW